MTDLAGGAHTFAVRAVDFDGNADPSPASRQFTVSVERASDCSAEEAELAKAKVKLKAARAKVRKAKGKAAVAKAKAKVKKAKARVRKAKGALASCKA